MKNQDIFALKHEKNSITYLMGTLIDAHPPASCWPDFQEQFGNLGILSMGIKL